MLGQLFAAALDTLNPGAVFSFTTLGISAPFVRCRDLPGTRPIHAMKPQRCRNAAVFVPILARAQPAAR